MIPTNLNDIEFIKYHSANATKEEVLDRYEKLAYAIDDLQAHEQKLESYYESSLEQSEFRRLVLEGINKICKDMKEKARYKETKELAHEFVLLIENSYVEL